MKSSGTSYTIGGFDIIVDMAKCIGCETELLKHQKIVCFGCYCDIELAEYEYDRARIAKEE